MNELVTVRWGKARPASQGRLVVFEGFDGVGKTTQLDLLAQHIERTGRHVLCTKQPTPEYRSNPLVRKFLDARESQPIKSARALAKLSAEDRRRHVDRVDVLCDRYVFSALAFFPARGVPEEKILAWNAELPRPDLAIYLRLDAAQIMLRLEERDGASTKREERDPDYIEKVLDNFMRYAHEFQVLDASDPCESIDRQIVTACKCLKK